MVGVRSTMHFHYEGAKVTDFQERDAITEYQAGNLDKLADYLLALPKDYNMFSMAYIMIRFDGEGRFTTCNRDVEKMPECGAVGCALGHAPLADVPYREGEAWTAMGHRELGICCSYVEGGFMNFGLLWDYCFTGGWVDYDNSPQGAGQRIKEFLHLAREGGFVR